MSRSKVFITRGTALICAVVFAGACVLACSGAQGDECSADSDCHSTLTCQPIAGRAKNYCCPTPAEMSDYATCHADKAALARASASGSGSGSEPPAQQPAADAATE
jgi:hypothetical protein